MWHKKGKRANSGVSNLNCLYQNENIFVMDNHKAALWSWFRKLNKKNNYNYLHIDRHYDLLISGLEDWTESVQNFKKGDIGDYSIEEYEKLEYECLGSPSYVFRYDNFFPIANNIYPNLFNNLLFITQKEGNGNEKYDLKEPEIYDIADNFSFWLENYSDEKKWIIDIDIDFFFTGDPAKPFLDIKFCEAIANDIYNIRDQIEVITIALSPEFCPSWDLSIEFANVFCEKFGFNFDF